MTEVEFLHQWWVIKLTSPDPPNNTLVPCKETCIMRSFPPNLNICWAVWCTCTPSMHVQSVWINFKSFRLTYRIKKKVEWMKRRGEFTQEQWDSVCLGHREAWGRLRKSTSLMNPTRVPKLDFWLLILHLLSKTASIAKLTTYFKKIRNHIYWKEKNVVRLIS